MMIGGLLFLFPLVFVTFVIGKAFGLVAKITTPIVDALMPARTIGGVAAVNIIVILTMALGCLVAGLIARSSMGRSIYRAVDANLASLIPGYAILKARLGDAVGNDTRHKTLKAVLMRADDYSQLAFEIERLTDGRVVVFTPGAPDPWSGSCIIVDAARVTPVTLDSLQMTRLLKDLGRGTATAIQGSPRAA
jgi:uncharacterized membrane protein